MSGHALGLIETYGYIGAVEAADTCLKAANVKLVEVQLVTGGLVTVEIIGDVGAVKAAVEAAGAAVEKVGRLVSTHVIPRPASDIWRLLAYGGEAPLQEEQREPVAVSAASTLTPEYIQKLNGMKVVELRSLARKLDGIRLERSRIRFATRRELLEAILEYHERK
jgi:ethanolamine utilization protein EutM